MKASTSSRSEADGKIGRLERILQETQTRLEDTERVKAEQSEKIKKLEQDLKDARHKQKGLRTKKEPLQEAVKTVQSVSVIGSYIRTIVCKNFSDDNYRVTVSRNKRSVKGIADWSVGCAAYGYCFLNHQKIYKNQILKWCLRVPKHWGGLGMVIIHE